MESPASRADSARPDATGPAAIQPPSVLSSTGSDRNHLALDGSGEVEPGEVEEDGRGEADGIDAVQ